jgi:hypothetical protein
MYLKFTLFLDTPQVREDNGNKNKGKLMALQGTVYDLHDRFGRNIGNAKSHSP